MDPRCVYLQKHQLPELIDSLVNKLVEANPENPRQFLANQLIAMTDAKYADTENCFNPAHTQTYVGKVLGRDHYVKFRHAHTAFGASLDDCLQDGLDYATGCRVVLPGAVPLPGLTACDEDCFVTLADVFQVVIHARHNVTYTARSCPYFGNDTAINKLRGGFSFDEKRVVIACCRLRRNVAGFRFAPMISRAERRSLESKLHHVAVSRFQGSSAGRWYTLTSIPDDLSAKTRNSCLLLPRFHSSPIRSSYREWPDARGLFLSDDLGTALHVNCGSEHIEIVAVAPRSNNVREAFDRAVEWGVTIDEGLKEHSLSTLNHPRLGFLTSDLNFIGSGITIEVCMVLPKVVDQPKFGDILKKLKVRLVPDFTSDPSDPTPTLEQLGAKEGYFESAPHATSPGPIGSTGLVTICNVETLTRTPAEALQTVIDAVEKLMELETLLEQPQQHTSGFQDDDDDDSV